MLLIFFSFAPNKQLQLL